MNKLVLIVLLAVCLVCTQAFVKRDAPAETKNEDTLATLQKQLEDLTKNVGESIKKAVDPEAIKKNFNEFVDQAQKVLQPKQQ